MTTTIASNVSRETMTDVLENSADLKGVAIEETTLRVYNDSVYLSLIHIFRPRPGTVRAARGKAHGLFGTASPANGAVCPGRGAAEPRDRAAGPAGGGAVPPNGAASPASGGTVPPGRAVSPAA